MRSVLRTVAVVTAVVAVGAPVAAGAQSDKGPRIKPKQPCTLLSAKQVHAKFGGPVTIDPSGQGSFFPTDCAYLVGDDPAVAPGGVLSVTVVFPGTFEGGGNASDALDDQRATDQTGGSTIRDVDDVGETAYLNVDTGTLSVVGSEKLAFSLRWLSPATAPTPVEGKVKKRVYALARNIAARAPG